MAAPVLRKAKQFDGPSAPADAAAGACDHCGDSLAGLRTVERDIDGRRWRFCCQGCAFIAEQLALVAKGGAGVEAGREPAATADPVGAVERCQLDVDGMVCSACALLIEHRVRALEGVTRARVDFGAQRLAVEYQPQRVAPKDIDALLRRLGYKAATDPARRRRAERVGLLRVLIAWLAMMQVMMLATPAYFAAPGDISADIAQLLRIGQCVLAVPVAVFCAVPLWRAAWSQIRVGRIGMDLPIVLGLAVAFIASVVATWRGEGAVYFDSVTMFVALVLSVRLWQVRALSRAAAHVDAVTRQSDLVGMRLVAYPESAEALAVEAARLVAGDHVAIAPGATVPADGRIVEGSTQVSVAWLTGEAAPQARACGDVVLAGSINLMQPIVVKVRRAGEATSLAALKRLTLDTAQERPAVVELANRVAVVFLWLVLATTAATIGGWWLVDPARVLPSAIAVLVATCPCALSLAAPAALLVAQSALARRGLLLSRVAALESLATIDAVVCDKTGTLTEGEPSLVGIVPVAAATERDVLALCASLEATANHPFAHAILAAARAAGIAPRRASDPQFVPACGVQAVVDGCLLRVGEANWALQIAPAAWRDGGTPLAARAVAAGLGEASLVVLAGEEGPLAVLGIAERLRDGAQRLVAQMRGAGREVWLLSGDQRPAVDRVGQALGLDRAHAMAQLSPATKLDWVIGLQRAHRRVVVIGDGLNDAPVIAQADASIAMASGADLAQARADLIALRSSLDDVGYAFELSRRAMRIVKGNLAWAFAYNAVIIPLAALGHLSPALAAAGMAASSAVVVANALRVARGAAPSAGSRAPVPA